MDCPPPTTAPTLEGGSPIIPKRYPPSPPPMAGNEGHLFQIKIRNFGPGVIRFPPPHPLQFCPDPGYQPIGSQTPDPGLRGYPSNDAVSYGDNKSLFRDYNDVEPGTASGIYDLINNDDGYILSDSTLPCTDENPTIVCASECTKTLSRSNSVILAKYASSCTGIHCTICKGSGSQLRNPEWMLDSDASAHFTPVFSDFITSTQFKEPLRVNTASSPLT